jgi:hypothetical protein
VCTRRPIYVVSLGSVTGCFVCSVEDSSGISHRLFNLPGKEGQGSCGSVSIARRRRAMRHRMKDVGKLHQGERRTDLRRCMPKQIEPQFLGQNFRPWRFPVRATTLVLEQSRTGLAGVRNQ